MISNHKIQRLTFIAGKGTPSWIVVSDDKRTDDLRKLKHNYCCFQIILHVNCSLTGTASYAIFELADEDLTLMHPLNNPAENLNHNLYNLNVMPAVMTGICIL